MSLPVRKNLSQGVGEQGSAASILKDSEMQSAKKTILMLDAENQTLRGTVEALQQSMEELHEAFEHAVQQSESKTREQLEVLLTAHAGELQVKADEMLKLDKQIADLQQDRDVHRVKAAAVDSCPVLPQSPAPPAPMVVPAADAPTPAMPKSHMDFLSPSHLRSSVKFRMAATPGSIAKRYLEGTPGARPVQWVVEQANTEVKRLRARAEQVARGEGGAVALTALDGYAAWSELHVGADAEGVGAQALWRMKMHSMKLRLSEALLVIQEQDRLIHSALLGRPVDMNEDFLLPASPSALAETTQTSGADGTVEGGAPAAAKAEVLHHLDNMATLKDFDFLPPASPATWALLQSYGWSCLPEQQATSMPAIAEEAKATLASEFDAED